MEYWHIVDASQMFFFFNDTATTEIYTLSLHDALPIFSASADAATLFSSARRRVLNSIRFSTARTDSKYSSSFIRSVLPRSEEHTSELQSRQYLVCRLLLEKKKVQLTSFLGVLT